MKRLFHEVSGQGSAVLLHARIVDKEKCLKAWPIVGIVLMQALLLAAHWFIYRTWIAFFGLAGASALRVLLLQLAFSFIAAALLGFYSASKVVTLLYRLASVWLGM